MTEKHSPVQIQELHMCQTRFLSTCHRKGTAFLRSNQPSPDHFIFPIEDQSLPRSDRFNRLKKSDLSTSVLTGFNPPESVRFGSESSPEEPLLARQVRPPNEECPSPTP